MKMISKVGALHTPPKPSTAVMDAAIGMLTVFGDPQKLKKLLTEIRDVQQHNEQVFKDAQAALSDVTKREKKMDEDFVQHVQENATAKTDIATRRRNLQVSEDRLATRISTFDQYEAAQTLELTERKAELDLGHRDLKAKLAAHDANKQDLDKRATVLDHQEQRNNDRRLKLKTREAKLRAALDG